MALLFNRLIKKSIYLCICVFLLVRCICVYYSSFSFLREETREVSFSISPGTIHYNFTWNSGQNFNFIFLQLVWVLFLAIDIESLCGNWNLKEILFTRGILLTMLMNKNRKQQKEDKMRRGFYIRTLENLIKLIEILLFINSVIFSKTYIYMYIYMYYLFISKTNVIYTWDIL